MDSKAILELVEQLEDKIDDLEESLEPLLTAALAATTKKLPLLDRAKLNVLVVYSIESLLFSYLKLQGVSVKEHPVFRELTRVKQYFEKIKAAEDGPVQPRENMSLNKEAANRIIKFNLADNNKSNNAPSNKQILEQKEREIREKILAQRRKILAARLKDEAAAKVADEEQAVSLQQLIQESLPVPAQQAPNQALHQELAQESAEEGEISQDEGELPEESEAEDSTQVDAEAEAADTAVGEAPPQSDTPARPFPKNRKRRSQAGDAVLPSPKPKKQKQKQKPPQKSKKQLRRERKAARKSQDAAVMSGGFVVE